MIGTRDRIAISCARRIFLIVSGHHEPALTVASFATTTTSRPATRPIVVTTPAAGAVPTSSAPFPPSPFPLLPPTPSSFHFSPLPTPPPPPPFDLLLSP